MVPPRFEYGDEVRVTRNVRNDGTFPGAEVGELLIRRGSTGFVRDVGTFLQDQIVYSVLFIEADRPIHGSSFRSTLPPVETRPQTSTS